jgi:hypothetical protein
VWFGKIPLDFHMPSLEDFYNAPNNEKEGCLKNEEVMKILHALIRKMGSEKF